MLQCGFELLFRLPPDIECVPDSFVREQLQPFLHPQHWGRDACSSVRIILGAHFIAALLSGEDFVVLLVVRICGIGCKAFVRQIALQKAKEIRQQRRDNFLHCALDHGVVIVSRSIRLDQLTTNALLIHKT